MQQLSTICYLDNGKQFLLLHRNKKNNDIHEGKWVSVGGKFEHGETPEECAKREIKEETGLNAKELIPVGFISFPDFTHDSVDWYSFVYRVIDFDGELIDNCNEGTLEWVDYEQIMAKPTWEGDYIYLEWILSNKPFFWAKFEYDVKGKLSHHSVSFMENRGGK